MLVGMAVARDYVQRAERLECLPAFQPRRGVRVIEDRRHPLVERHIAGDDEFLLGEPDRNVAGRMGRAEVENLDREAAHLDDLLVLERLGRSLMRVESTFDLSRL
jgi:hypothetical protein